MHNLRSFSVDTQTGEAHYGAKDTRNDPERYLHVLVPLHMVARYEALTGPNTGGVRTRLLERGLQT